VRANFLKLLQLVSRGVPLPLGRVRNARSLAYVGNLVDAISLCLEHPAAAGETFLVADGESPSTKELVLKLGSLLGRPARLAPVPVPLLRLGGRLAGRSNQVERLVGTLTVSTAKIRRVLGWSPSYSMEEGLEETALWFERSA
jgi:nucleoside-diphosphate-sugar epimerase